MKVLMHRAGSGQVVHRAEEHGVSSYRLGCGRILLRRGIRTVEDTSPLPPGTSECPKCHKPCGHEHPDRPGWVCAIRGPHEAGRHYYRRAAA